MQSIKEYVAERKEALKREFGDLEFCQLAIIQVGDVEASSRYVRNKLKDCEEVGLSAMLVHLPEDTTEAELLELINSFNEDPEITGFIVQLPLPKHISEQCVIEAISPLKDVDGFSKLAVVNPGTPQGVIDYLDSQGFQYQDKNAVVIGRSNIVGKPLARLLLEKNCNVTQLHSKTGEANKRLALENADLICVATGHRNTIDASYRLKPTAVICDIGINFNESGKLVGDVEQELPVAFKSPVPGGFGLCTRLALLTNLLKLYKIQHCLDQKVYKA